MDDAHCIFFAVLDQPPIYSPRGESYQAMHAIDSNEAKKLGLKRHEVRKLEEPLSAQD